nr:hypothetical protein FFPRI1PSEUD_38470 [Pseudomonas sp. FFPRI_1]
MTQQRAAAEPAKVIPCALHALIRDGPPLAPQQPQPRVPCWSFTQTLRCAAPLNLVRDSLPGLDQPLPQGPFSLRQLLRYQAGE